MIKTYLLLSALALTASACATSAGAPGLSGDAGADTAWTAEQQSDYDQCLQDNMAVATAWEMIEESCREQVDGDALGLDVED